MSIWKLKITRKFVFSEKGGKDSMNKDKQPILYPGDKIIYNENDPHIWYDNMKEALENAGFTLSKEVS